MTKETIMEELANLIKIEEIYTRTCVDAVQFNS